MLSLLIPLAVGCALGFILEPKITALLAKLKSPTPPAA